ncbi:MAG: DUF1289 domain-containing protein [Alphaproteobacteria bacterium]|nr:DUF1289 domain-containing protein [Alphaproteobacteria bacterium]
MAASVPSPCIGLCILDPATGFCKGCFRTIEEIGAWIALDDDCRREILRLVFERRDSDVE